MKKVILGIVVLAVVFSAAVGFAKTEDEDSNLYSEKVMKNVTQNVPETYESDQLTNLYLLDIITVSKEVREQGKEVVKATKENTILLQKQISLLEKLVEANE